MAGTNIPLQDAGEEVKPKVFTAPWGDMPIQTGWTSAGKSVTRQQTGKPTPLRDAGVGKVAAVDESTPSPGGSLAQTTFNPKDNKLPTSVNPAPFKADKTKPDGGAIGWLGKIFNEKRKPGETDDEYDERVTRNREKILALGDAIRHMGNIYNTTRYAKSQQFNSPISQLESDLANRKALRMKKAAADADMAYKAAKLQRQADQDAATAAYRDQMLGYKKAAMERQAARDKVSDDHWQATMDRNNANDKFNHDMSKAKFDEARRHNGVAESQGAQRIALARQREAREAAKGGGRGSGGSMTNLATPTGHMNRKKDLNTAERKQLAQWMMENGYINQDNMNTYNSSTSQDQGALINYWIAYAAQHPGARGDKFRQRLKTHHGYTETTTTGTARSSIRI